MKPSGGGVVVKPAPVTVDVSAIWTADLFSDGTKGFDQPWDHCIGTQDTYSCRSVIVFDVSTLPKNKPITSVNLKITVPYVTEGMESSTVMIGRYAGSSCIDPRTDPGLAAYACAQSSAYIPAETAMRTTGTKVLDLNQAIPDLSAAIRDGKIFIVSLKSNNEGQLNRFTTLGRYGEPETIPVLSVKH